MRATARSMRIARQQRRSMSPPEVKLWTLLRRSPEGIRFRRQHSIGPYVADFYCPAAKLVIEIDGSAHDSAAAAEHDRMRNEYMMKLGLKVLRIAASEVLADPAAVADGLLSLCGPSTTQLR
ncbi:MAG: endonuclease domain-containing protein [Sphingomonas sp.]|nr:endonuclease domain-containing protein [Sphingomonas sp.]